MNNTIETASQIQLEANKALVRRLLLAYSRPNAEQILDECVAPGYVHHFTGGPSDANLADYKRQMEPFSRAFPDGKLEIHALIAEGDLVSARSTFTGTNSQDGLGMSATGKQVSVPVFAVYRVADGRVQEAWQLTDNLGMRKQLGLLPTRSGG